jgi:GntR family transcriptional repressor for pyruvate dehydrogenase complex
VGITVDPRSITFYDLIIQDSYLIDHGAGMSVISPPDLDRPVKRVIDYITGRELGEGTRLPPIKQLAKELGLGPHAVRDALLHAQTIGLVQVRPRSGVFVRSPNSLSPVDALTRVLPVCLADADSKLLDVLEARRILESELAGVAAARRRMADLVPARDAVRKMYADARDYEAYVRHNENFHVAVARIAGNEILLAVLRQLIGMMRNVLIERRPASWADEYSRKREIDRQEHEAILAALVAGDPAAARTAMLAHLRDTIDSLMPATDDAVAGNTSPAR